METRYVRLIENFPFQDNLDNAYNVAQSLSLYIWALCAGVSMFTSKLLLVDMNLHYPLHLHLLQLSTATLLVLLCSSSRRQCTRLPTFAECTAIFGASCLMALSTGFSLQAILHFPNLTTLTMFSAFFSFIRISRKNISGQSKASSKDGIRLSYVALCCGGILYGEYRLTVKGSLAAIAATILAATADATLSSVGKNTAASLKRVDTLFYCSAFAITVTWAASKETSIDAYEDLRLGCLPLLLINVLSTAGTIFLSKSILFPPGNLTHHIPHSSSDGCTVRKVAALLVLTGATGCLTTLTLQRSYTTSLQIWAFLTAILCLDNGSTLKFHYPPGKDAEDAITLRHIISEVDVEGHLAGNMSEGPDLPRSSHSVLSRRELCIAAFTVACIWVIFPMLNFHETRHPRMAPTLDHAYVPPIASEIVISMYQETLPTVHSLISTLRDDIPSLTGAHVHIYTKSSDADIELIQQHTGADNVTQLPNIGREGETFLHHIISQWDSLAEHTLFVQADVHNPREFYARIRQYFDPRQTGMLSLGFTGHVCSCDHGCGDQWGWRESSDVISRIHDQVYNVSGPYTESCTNILLSYKGQFIVSGRRIRGITKTAYIELQHALADKDSWAHQEDYLKGASDSLNAPAFGYTLERLWNFIFQCSDVDIAWKCPSLLSGERMGGSIQDCQCFDTIS